MPSFGSFFSYTLLPLTLRLCIRSIFFTGLSTISLLGFYTMCRPDLSFIRPDLVSHSEVHSKEALH